MYRAGNVSSYDVRVRQASYEITSGHARGQLKNQRTSFRAGQHLRARYEEKSPNSHWEVVLILLHYAHMENLLQDEARAEATPKIGVGDIDITHCGGKSTISRAILSIRRSRKRGWV